MSKFLEPFTYPETKAQVALLETKLEQLKNHPVFNYISNIYDLQTLMQWQVFAVWEFMSIVKRLQCEYTGLRFPWVPPRNQQTARFFNELVLALESYKTEDGSHQSHLEFYIEAMRDSNTTTKVIVEFINLLRFGLPPVVAAERAGANEEIKTSVSATTETVNSSSNEVVLSTFLFGYVAAIPTMFKNIKTKLKVPEESIHKYSRYLQYYIDLDSDEFNAVAIETLVAELDGDVIRTEAALKAALDVINRYIKLFDVLQLSIEVNKPLQ